MNKRRHVVFVDVNSLVDELKATADEIMVWANSDKNRGPFGEELYRTNVQVVFALNRLGERLHERGERRLAQAEGRDGS